MATGCRAQRSEERSVAACGACRCLYRRAPALVAREACGGWEQQGRPARPQPASSAPQHPALALADPGRPTPPPRRVGCTHLPVTHSSPPSMPATPSCPSPPATPTPALPGGGNSSTPRPTGARLIASSRFCLCQIWPQGACGSACFVAVLHLLP